MGEIVWMTPTAPDPGLEPSSPSPRRPRRPSPWPTGGGAALRNVEQIARFEEEQLRCRTGSERVAGTVTRVAGTATFAIAHLVWFAGWILVNLGWVHGIRPFDPFPFSLLTMVVSLEAIFLSIWILISQNQMTRQADRRTHLDLQVNLLAEQESTATLRVLERIAERLGVDATQEADPSLAEETDLEHLASAVGNTLPDSPAAAGPQPPASIRS